MVKPLKTKDKEKIYKGLKTMLHVGEKTMKTNKQTNNKPPTSHRNTGGQKMTGNIFKRLEKKIVSSEFYI